jgi:hypothetical protein
MSNRVSKARAPSRKTHEYNALLSVVLANSVEMPKPCFECDRQGRQCSASVQDSSRCSECVRLKLSYCDFAALSPQQIRRIGSQHSKLEAELEAAEEEAALANAKIQRLRKQKKLWFEKMMRAVSRGLDSLESLERVEAEEAEREEARRRESEAAGSPLGRSSTEGLVSEGFSSDWGATFGEAPLEPWMMEDFNMVARSHVSGGNDGGAVERSSDA